MKAKLQRYDTMLEQIQIRRSELNQRLFFLKSEAVSRKEQMAAYAQEKQALDHQKDELQGKLKGRSGKRQ